MVQLQRWSARVAPVEVEEALQPQEAASAPRPPGSAAEEWLQGVWGRRRRRDGRGCDRQCHRNPEHI